MLNSFFPGQLWLDTDGNPIQAHGGGILFHENTYYWFGENKNGPTRLDPKPGSWERVDVIGISCYSSTDLYNWKNEGIVLPAVTEKAEHDLHPSKVLERPKVLFNRQTGKFVMFTHVDTADYYKACVGVSVAASPTGPYQYLGSFQPNGHDSRDMTVFKDGDAAYLVHSSEWNKNLHIAALGEDYLNPTGVETIIYAGKSREAPAVFMHRSNFYMITSGCTGWDPNAADLGMASSPLGDWVSCGNPCRGADAEATFHAQSAFVLPVHGIEGAFIAMFDRWNPKDLGSSRYVWLPVMIRDSKIEIPWMDQWDLSIFNK